MMVSNFRSCCQKLRRIFDAHNPIIGESSFVYCISRLALSSATKRNELLRNCERLSTNKNPNGYPYMHRFLKWEHVCFANSMENAELMTRWYNVKLTVEARHWLFAVKVEEFRFKNSALFKRVREIKKLNKIYYKILT